MFRQVCAGFGLSEGRVLRRMGLPPDAYAAGDVLVDARTFFDGWTAIYEEAGRPDVLEILERSSAGAPVTPALFAFSCSPIVETGLRRLSIFKPLVAPVSIGLEHRQGDLVVSVASYETGGPMPASMAAFDIVFFLQSIRTFTGVHVVPKSVQLVDTAFATEAYRALVATPIGQGNCAEMVLRAEDAALPLTSEDAEFWKLIEQELTGQLRKLERDESTAVQVRNILIETLPSGHVSVDVICRRLGVSRRSLQRALKAEGQTFQSILHATRAELARNYLQRSDMTAEEISHLLAYRDPNSFYRAFQSWTGMTPSQARAAPAYLG